MTIKKYMSCLRLKHKQKRGKQVVFLMILNGEGWHYITVKKLIALLRGIISKRHCEFLSLPELPLLFRNEK